MIPYSSSILSIISVRSSLVIIIHPYFYFSDVFCRLMGIL